MQPVQATCGVEKSTLGKQRALPHRDTFTNFLNHCLVLAEVLSCNFAQQAISWITASPKVGVRMEPADLEHLDSVKRTIKKAEVSRSCPGNRIWLLLPLYTQGYNVLYLLSEAEQPCSPVLQDTGGHTGILKGRASHSQGYSQWSHPGLSIMPASTCTLNSTCLLHGHAHSSLCLTQWLSAFALCFVEKPRLPLFFPLSSAFLPSLL